MECNFPNFTGYKAATMRCDIMLPRCSIILGTLAIALLINIIIYKIATLEESSYSIHASVDRYDSSRTAGHESCWARWIKEEFKKRPPSIATQLRNKPNSTDILGIPMSNNVRRFVVLSTQHSGTTWFTHCLNSHPEVASLIHEIMLRMTHGGANISDWSWQKTYYLMNTVSCHQCERKSLVQCATNSTSNLNEGRSVGFGVQYNQGWHDEGQLRAILPVWKRNDVHVIVLERRNALAHMIASGGVKKPGMPVANTSHRLDRDTLYGMKATVYDEHMKFEKLRSLVKNHAVPMLCVTYEALLLNPGVEFSQVFSFLFHEPKTKKSSRFEFTPNVDGVGTSLVLRDQAHKNWNLTFDSNDRIHAQTMEQRIENYSEALKTLLEIYPEGACMLSEDCDWFSLCSP